MNPFDQVKAAIKKNPKVALAAAAGGGFLLIKRKGGSTGTGVTTVVQPVDSGFNSEVAGEASGDSSLDPSLNEPVYPVDPAPAPVTPEIPDAPETPITETPTPSAPVPDPVPAEPQNDGITVAGHFFRGATGHTQVGKGKNAGGEYTIQLISYPTKSERWWHYFSGKNSGKWSGPHGGTGNSGGSVTPTPVSAGGSKPVVSTPAPAPKPAPTPAPTPVFAGGGTSIGSGLTSGLGLSNPLGGITVADHYFVGGTGHTQIGNGSNDGGKYTIIQVTFKQKAPEKWWHYYSGNNNGKWSGPH